MLKNVIYINIRMLWKWGKMLHVGHFTAASKAKKTILEEHRSDVR